MKAIASPNIAFIKYWGKLNTTTDNDRNLATNDSLSMTLSEARTTTIAKKTNLNSHRVIINQKEANTKDYEKVARHISRVLEYFEADSSLYFQIDSENNFPQGTGIASSASAFAALTLAVAGEVLGLERAKEILFTQPEVFSSLSRRGSGSASRSIEGGFVKWHGESAKALDSKWKLFDTILIFSEEHKTVPSSEGHALAQSSPLFAERLTKIQARMKIVENSIKSRDLNQLGPILEEEALELHRIAASSLPSVVYLNPESQRFIQFLEKNMERDFYFTLDAGPNVHLISESPIKNLTEILKEAKLNTQPRIWSDFTGQGAQLLP